MGKHNWQERALIASLLAACVVLAFLQYRWTGELSQAYTQRLFATASGRLQQFTRAFDTELRQSVLDFIPAEEEVRRMGPERANAERRTRAMARLERPMFRRVGAAVPDRSRQTLAFVDGTWPESADWQGLRNRLRSISMGEDPGGGIIDPTTPLIEVPVFVDGVEREWMLFELDADYAARTWLPELVRTYINPEGEENFRIGIQWGASGSKWVVGQPLAGEFSARSDATASIFPVRFLGGGGGGRRGEPGRWRVQLTHREGSVPAAVRSARLRNLAIAFLPLALIAVAGAALVRNTRQARRLADAQFQFFAGISHELRTPLTVIQGAGHNLLSGVVKDVYRVLKGSGLVETVGKENIFPASPANPNLATRNALKRAQAILGIKDADVRIYYDPAKQAKK